MGRLFTRRRHGSLPVMVVGRGGQQRLKLTQRDGTRVEYESMRALLRALHAGRESGYSFDRYFRVGRWDQPVESDLVEHSIMEMFGPEPGIDVGEKAEDIAKILYRYFGAVASQYGYSLEDILQDVYRGILVRNRGKCPFNPSKASFGHYVYMVCTCVFRNYHKREQRRRGRETIGCRQFKGKRWVVADAATVAAESRPAGDHDRDLYELQEVADDLLEWLEDQPDADEPIACLAREILPLRLQDMRRSEIADKIGKPRHVVGYALAYLRKVTTEWKNIILDGETVAVT